MSRTCSACQHDNPPDNKFCAQCGSALLEAVPTTAADTIKDVPSGDAGERRFVSVLFADLVGFTTFSELRDPEEIRSMLTRYFERAQEVIERFGGEVDKFIGDAVTAFWGAKRALEDDAERAVRAGLELVDAVEALGTELGIPELVLRVGVLSGETSVGSGGNDQGLVVGDIVNTASRLQSAAGPGTVFVGESTHRLTSEAVRYESVGTFDMKGKSTPVDAWQAISVVGQRGGAGKWEALEPPFVGRDDELRLLKDQLHATTRDGTARLVSIIGEAGIGKSRLAWELLKYVDGITETIRWHQGRSPAYGEGVTFWALAEMVRSRAGISDTDETLKARTKLRTMVAEYVAEVDEQQWIEPRLAGLLGLADMPSGDRNELYAALRGFFQHVAGTGTTVLLFEDIHWADDGQLEFIEELVEMSPEHPILVITLSRPELLDRYQRWGAARHHSLSTHLGPLADAEMTALVTGMAPGISDHIVKLVINRAGGVPLYAVEYVRMLVNSGDLVLEGSTYRQTRELSEVSLPESLHALVGARLDRLDDESRLLLQDAAVLGQSFTVEGMTVLTGGSAADLGPKLRGLARHELLRYEDSPRSPERGQFQFIQSVIREVAYGRIAKAERKDRHILVAEYYEREAPVEAAAVIASHYMSAYEASPDDSLADRARDSLTRAAARANELKSFAQALTLIEQALEVPGGEDHRAAVWSQAVEPANALYRHEEAVGYARKAFGWYRDHGTADEVIVAAELVGNALVVADQPLEAVETLAPFFNAERAGERAMMRLGGTLSNGHMRSIQMADAAEVALSVMMAAEAKGNTRLLIDAMITRGSSLRNLQRGAEAIALLREALRLAERAGLPYETLRAINNLLLEESANGGAGMAEFVERGYELAHKIRQPALLVRLTTSYAESLFRQGQFDQAREVLASIEPGQESDWATAIAAFDAFVRWALSGESADLAEARELNIAGLESVEPQYRGHAKSIESVHLARFGDLSGAINTAHHVEVQLPGQDHWHAAVGAAIRLGDPERLRSVRTLFDGFRGQRFDVLDFAVETGLKLLEGDSDRAAGMFEELIDRLSVVEGPVFASEWRAIFAEVMPDRPEAREAARNAHEWFSDVGANGYLGLYSHVWDLHLSEQAETG